MAKAGNSHGLGEILSDGYELTDHVVVDDDHTFDGNNEVIEKLITGFKTSKEGIFKSHGQQLNNLGTWEAIHATEQGFARGGDAYMLL